MTAYVGIAGFVQRKGWLPARGRHRVYDLNMPSFGVLINVPQVIRSRMGDMGITSAIEGQRRRVADNPRRVHWYHLPAKPVLMCVLEVPIGPVLVADVRLPGLIKNEEGPGTDRSRCVHGLKVPLRLVQIGVLQIIAIVFLIADMREAEGIEGQRGIKCHVT